MSNHTDVKNARRFHNTSSASSKFHSKSYTENTVMRLFIYGKIQLIRTVGTIRILNVFNLSGQASWLNTFNKTIPMEAYLFTTSDTQIVGRTSTLDSQYVKKL